MTSTPAPSKVKSPLPTAEEEEVLDDFKKVLAKMAATEQEAREVSKRVGAEIVRRKSIPQMRIPAELRNAAAVKR